MHVKEIMTKDPICCTANTSLQDVARLMVEYDCGSIPIVDGESSRKPIGVITDRDIVCRVVAHGKNPLNMPVNAAMTNHVVTVAPETTLEDCCNIMEKNQIRRIAVVDATGACCGILAQADIAIKAGENKTAEVVQEVSRAAYA